MLTSSQLKRYSLLLFVLVACSEISFAQLQSLALSPDGKLIAATYRKDHTSFIYRIATDTGRATRLTDAKTGAESGPAFSADGKRIAYSYNPGSGEHFRIVIADVDGSNRHSWSPSEANDFSPAFSPDNQTIVFARSRYYGSYSPIAQPHHHAWDFYAGGLDGTNVRQLTSERFYMASAPSLSPDGKNMLAVIEGADTGRQIAIYSLDHPECPTLTFRPHVPKEVDRKDPITNYPNYMPDGKHILFMAASNGKHGFDYDVYLLDIGTGALERLTSGNGYATDLRVSADGKAAAFLKWRSDWHGTPVKNELFLLDPQSKQLTTLKVSGLD